MVVHVQAKYQKDQIMKKSMMDDDVQRMARHRISFTDYAAAELKNEIETLLAPS